jgi:hypothetical protein
MGLLKRVTPAAVGEASHEANYGIRSMPDVKNLIPVI